VKSNVYTDEQGRFQFGGLTPAIYEIIVEPDGNRFEKARARVEVFPGAPANINISLSEKKTAETKPTTRVVSAGELDTSVPGKAKKEFQRASDLAEAGRIDEAILHLRKAIEIYPNYLMAHNDLGTHLLAQQKLDEAISEFRRAIEIDPKAFNPHLNLGIVLVQQKQFGAALTTLHEALALKSDSAAAILYDGLARQGLKDLEGAERQLLLAHNLGGAPFALALFHLGQIYSDRGDRSRAREALEEFLREQPNAPESAEARKLLRILR
jgi:tetratricopeptide (TPR) repeat protein